MTNAKPVKVINQGGFGGAYFVAMIGAIIYFVQHSFGFWGFVLAVLKGIVWPAYLVHAGLKALGV